MASFRFLNCLFLSLSFSFFPSLPDILLFRLLTVKITIHFCFSKPKKKLFFKKKNVGGSDDRAVDEKKNKQINLNRFEFLKRHI